MINKKLIFSLLSVVVVACSSNNCPVENNVYCNIAYYDSNGTAIKYPDTITVSTLMPGWKTQYIYRQLGQLTITSDTVKPDLVEKGYLETVVTNRNTQVLINRSINQSLIQIPMSYFNPVDTFIFTYGSISQQDTLYIEKESYSHVEYPECGTYRFHNLKSIKFTEAAFDTIEIASSSVNYDGKENIKIHFNGVAQ